MATVNFSVPEDVKAEFDRAFAGENKSAVIAELMRQAVEARRLQARRAKAVAALLDSRRSAPRVSSGKAGTARRRGRP